MPTSTYLEIISLQSPIAIGNDTAKRAMLSFNVVARIVGIQIAFEKEICKLIQNAGLATLGTDMWYGSLAQLSDIPAAAPGAYIVVLPTGGLSPLQTHNGDRSARPSAQIITRSLSYVTASDKANAIQALLDGRHNITIMT